MSIVRIGLGETKKFAEGYDAIFGKKKAAAGQATVKDQRAAKAATRKRVKKGKKK